MTPLCLVCLALRQLFLSLWFHVGAWALASKMCVTDSWSTGILWELMYGSASAQISVGDEEDEEDRIIVNNKLGTSFLIFMFL